MENKKEKREGLLAAQPSILLYLYSKEITFFVFTKTL